MIKIEIFTNGGDYEDAKKLAKANGLDATEIIEKKPSAVSVNKPGSPQKAKNQYHALELR